MAMVEAAPAFQPAIGDDLVILLVPPPSDTKILLVQLTSCVAAWSEGAPSTVRAVAITRVISFFMFLALLSGVEKYGIFAHLEDADGPTVA
jgi:hypothetical protein